MGKTNKNNQQVAGDSTKADGVERDHKPAGTTAQANSQTKAEDRVKPPVAANGLKADASDEAYSANNQVNPLADAKEIRDLEDKSGAEKVQTRVDEVKEVDTKLGSSEEEAAAERAGVMGEALENPKQNREPKNVFEKSNQKVTEEERQAAQKVSDMTATEKEDKAPSFDENAKTDAARTAEVNQGSEIAAAIAQGMKDSKEDKTSKITTDTSVEPRFALVKNAAGEVLVRENETGNLSKIQLESLEEKESSIQGQEVTEL